MPPFKPTIVLPAPAAHDASDAPTPMGISPARSHDDDDLLTTEQLAARWNVPPSRLHKERAAGGGCPYIKMGHLVRYRWGDARAHAAARRIAA